MSFTLKKYCLVGRHAALWNELKFEDIEMLSRRVLYREAEETRRFRLRYMAHYNIELIARNRALKIQI